MVWHDKIEQAMNSTHNTISYHALLDALPEAAMVLDDEFCVISCNSRFLALLHQDAKTVLGRRLVEILPPTEAMLEILKAQNREEVMLLGRFLEATLTPLDAKSGASLLLLYDKTVSKLTEQALLSHEQRYRALFEHSNDAIFILESDLTIIIANEQAAAYLQEDLGILLQRSILRYIPKEAHENFKHYSDSIYKGHLVPIYETFLLGADKESFPVELSLTLVRDSQRQPLHIQVIARDIQERRRNEALLKNRISQLDKLLEIESHLNGTLDMNQVVNIALDSAISLSRADAGFIALNNEGQLAVTHVGGAYFPAVIGSPINYRVGVVGRVLEEHEAYLVQNVDEDPYYYRDIPATQALMAFPLISQERLVGILNLESFERDEFTEEVFHFIHLLANRIAVAIDNARLYEYVRKQLDELFALYNELHEAEKLKTDMMRIANHDLKNPLSIVRGYVDLLLMDSKEFSADILVYLRSMRDSLERADQILYDFLSVDAITARIQASNRRFDLKNSLTRALEEFKLQALEKGIELEANFMSAEAYVKGDEVQIYEAIANLVNNAIKYTPQGGKIWLDLELDAEQRLVLRVKDTGYGIPLERQARLFEPFYRPKTAETAKIEGTGLGLHLVKNIVERHRGEIIFESVYHQGSTFGFRLPLAVAD